MGRAFGHKFHRTERNRFEPEHFFNVDFPPPTISLERAKKLTRFLVKEGPPLKQTEGIVAVCAECAYDDSSSSWHTDRDAVSLTVSKSFDKDVFQIPQGMDVATQLVKKKELMLSSYLNFQVSLNQKNHNFLIQTLLIFLVHTEHLHLFT